MCVPMWFRRKKNETPTKPSLSAPAPPPPSPELAADALLSLRGHRRQISEVLREYPVMCSMPGLYRVLTSDADLDALDAELERLAKTELPTVPHQND